MFGGTVMADIDRVYCISVVMDHTKVSWNPEKDRIVRNLYMTSKSDMKWEKLPRATQLQ